MRRLTDTASENSLTSLSADNFAALMEYFVSETLPPSIALAVSGGPDSMALAFLARDWAFSRPITLAAFIIDHALRDVSASEAIITQSRLASLGLHAEILRWEHDPVVTRVHVRARAARYELLTEACKKQGIRHLMTAHHREDQAETILMRLAKGSGIDGLAGMAAQSVKKDVHIWRPFLSVSKARLIATCDAAKLDYINDGSNNSTQFARGRLRRLLPLLADEGLTIDRILDLGARAASAKEALDHTARQFVLDATQMDSSGALHYDTESFRTLPMAIAERVLTAGLQCIHRRDYPPEHMPLHDLAASLRDVVPLPARTLHGCFITQGKKQISLIRETDAIKPMPIQPGESGLWDGRWQVQLAKDTPGKDLSVRPLGTPSRDVLGILAPGLDDDIPQGRARASLPALWSGEKVVSIARFGKHRSPGGLGAELVQAWPPKA